MAQTRKKLIEVALPLEAINEASAAEKSNPFIKGHPRQLHLWWARRPLAACRAVIFASLVDDPDDPEAPANFVAACRALPRGKNAAENDTPRQRLFDFIERLVLWESTTDEQVLETARELIRLATNGNPPPLLDPFAGGGSIPLEAQRLGLEAHASDLNPVAVMINKALIEIPPKFANHPPVNPRDREKAGGGGSWKGAAGLAADVRYYGEWMRERAWERIGHLYPECNGETVIAWLWARTVKCPNPACGAQMPLVRSFDLSTKVGRRAWVEPHVDAATRRVIFTVKQNQPKGKGPEGTVNRQGAVCLACGTPVPFEYIRDEGRVGRMSAQLMAIVSEGSRQRSYHAPTPAHEQMAETGIPESAPKTDLPEQALGFRVQLYGMTKHRDLYTQRQLVAMTILSNLVTEAKQEIERDIQLSGLQKHDALGYAEGMIVYLGLAVSNSANYMSTLCGWNTTNENIKNTFSRQSLPMTWDFAESNPFGPKLPIDSFFEWVSSALEYLGLSLTPSYAKQQDATQLDFNERMLICTDPPYYDNIGYADLSDYFYVWQRQALQNTLPDIYSTLLSPKAAELIASPFRHAGNSDIANQYFEEGLLNAFRSLYQVSSLAYPLSTFYAFKQSEIVLSGEESRISSTGWETMLESLIKADFVIGGTWPIRTERTSGLKNSANMLASSIVLVCRPRPDDAPTTTRRDFVNALRRELPPALHEMQSGAIAPVDLAQASIGPGMRVYSRYSKILEPNGDRLTVRTALQLINQELDAYLAEQEGDLDPASRFAVAWFEQYGFNAGDFGTADVLARAKNTSVDTLARAGFLDSGVGKVRLLTSDELDPGQLPEGEVRVTVWEAVHYLVERLNTHGEQGAALLLARMPADLSAEARQLAYRLYSICERKGWANHARNYNALVVSWGSSQEQAQQLKQQYQQGMLF